MVSEERSECKKKASADAAALRKRNLERAGHRQQTEPSEKKQCTPKESHTLMEQLAHTTRLAQDSTKLAMEQIKSQPLLISAVSQVVAASAGRQHGPTAGGSYVSDFPTMLSRFQDPSEFTLRGLKKMGNIQPSDLNTLSLKELEEYMEKTQPPLELGEKCAVRKFYNTHATP